MRGVQIAAMSIPVVLMFGLYLGAVAYSPEKQRQYPTSYGLDAKIAKARADLKLKMEGAGDPGGIPRVEVEEQVADLGIVPPHTSRTTHFQVTNRGTGRLDLLGGAISCKCVDYKVTDRQLEPGESAEISLTWNTGNPAELLTQTLVFGTNDPEVPELRFEVHARVSVELAAQPASLVFGRQLPGRIGGTAETVLFSEEWDQIVDPQIIVSDDRIRARLVDDVPSESLSSGVTWARRLETEIVGEFPVGQLAVMVRVEGTAPDGSLLAVDLPVEGFVARRLTVGGPQLDASGYVDFGVLPAHQGASTVLTVRVNDDEPELVIRSLQVDPEYVSAELSPIDASRGLYRLTIAIPQHAPAAARSGERSGKLRIEFDHPRVEPLELDVRFVVLSAIGS